MIRYLSSFEIAWESIQGNKVRALLTGIGISFGIASVISMLAIGRGAKVEILDALNHIGENNIVVKSISKQVINDKMRNIESKSLSDGLSLIDIDRIWKVIPDIEQISPFVSHQSDVIYKSKSSDIELIGISSQYFSLVNLKIKAGMFFSSAQENNGDAVCVLNADLAGILFKTENPLGKQIRCNNVYFTVVGILESQQKTPDVLDNSDFVFKNNSVYIPIKSMLIRVKSWNKISINSQQVPKSADTEKVNNESKNNGQIDKIFIKVRNYKQVKNTSRLVLKILDKTHHHTKSFKIIIPEEIIKQQEKTKNIFNLVLAVIAGISLLVGGIGIMNITFTSVLERTREIGIRLAVGANRKDIGFQFLNEAVLISLAGGIIGIFLGFIISTLISSLTDIETIITIGSVFLSFIISVSIGILFGYIPAKNASCRNPIESLRHE